MTRETINFHKEFGHLKTWKKNDVGEDFGWHHQNGILNGVAGIGLTLLSSICDIEPKWDRCLLLS